MKALRIDRARHRRLGMLWAAFTATSVIVGVLASGLGLPITAGVGEAATVGVDMLSGTAVASIPPTVPRTSVMVAADGTPIAYFYRENRMQVPLSQMSPLVQNAIVAIEDSRYFRHGAVDPQGLLRAAAHDAVGGAVQGGSTITQQYAKNLLLEQAVAAGDAAAIRAATADTAARKVRELRLAIALERRFSKAQLLEGYLNIVYFDQQTYGVQAAALRYFGVSAAHLDLPQAALLAGMVHEPSADDPVLHPLAARSRRNVVLRAMLDQKMITAAQEAAALRAPVTVTGRPVPNGCDPAGADGFFCEYVVRSIATDPAYAALGATPAERENALLTGGLVIRTTLDRRTQASAVHAVATALPATDPSGLATTAVTVEPGTGAVLSMAEDRAYSTTAGAGGTTVNYATDFELGGSRGFQTGSSFKPFTLAAWLAAGHGLNDRVDATRRSFPFSRFTACGQPLVGSTPYTPGNSEGRETGPMSVSAATAKSVNVAYVDMESRLDLCSVAATAEALGVHLAAPENVCDAATPSVALPTCLPSLTLGVENIAPLTMAAAYAGFAAHGRYCVPQPIRSVVRAATLDSPPTTLVSSAPACRQVLPPPVVAGVDAALSRVLTTGTAAAVGPLHPWPSAGKTGTTDGPYDTWFVGYTAQRATAVWVGDPGRVVRGSVVRRRLTDITVNGRYYATVFGASIAAPIWKAVMEVAMRGLPPERW